MLWLRNINQYDKPIREEFEHVISQITVFLSQLFDEDGNFVEGSTAVTSPIKFIHYGDIAVNNGVASGTSTLPQEVDVTKTVLHYLGVNSSVESFNSTIHKITLTNSTTVTATRTGTSGDAVVNYVVVEYN